MAFDKMNDCADGSDEFHFVDELGKLGDIKADGLEYGSDQRCGSAHWFPCDDAGLLCTATLWSKPSCSSKRDLHYIRALLQPANGDTHDVCWIFAICQLSFRHFFTEETSISSEQCQLASQRCVATVEEFIFPFVTTSFIAHPSVKFIYRTNRSFSDTIVPELICFDAEKCRHRFTPALQKFNLSCNPWTEVVGNLYI